MNARGAKQAQVNAVAKKATAKSVGVSSELINEH